MGTIKSSASRNGVGVVPGENKSGISRVRDHADLSQQEGNGTVSEWTRTSLTVFGVETMQTQARKSRDGDHA